LPEAVEAVFSRLTKRLAKSKNSSGTGGTGANGSGKGSGEDEDEDEDEDDLLTQIWAVGVETTRSCVEDSCIDGPCRERGQWTGDTLAVSLQVQCSILYTTHSSSIDTLSRCRYSILYTTHSSSIDTL
jgi:hypothetical protein